MARTIVGVDISSSGVRAAEVGGAATDRPTLVNRHSVSLPAGAVVRGQVMEPHLVVSAIKQLWSAARFRSKDVVLGVGNSSVVVRNHVLPRETPGIMMESLPFQVQELIPFPVESAVLDFYPINERQGDTGPVVNGLLVAAVKESVLANVTAVQQSGLNPVNVDLLPFAATRALLRGTRGQGTTALIDLGAQTTTVIVATDGVPQFVRIVGSGGDDITAGLADRLGISREQAESIKRSVGLDLSNGSESRGVTDAMIALGTDLINSLRSTLVYFATSQPSNPIQHIILTGGGAQMIGLGDALAESTRLSWHIGNPFEGLRHPGKGGAPLTDTDSMANAIGLALGSTL